MILLWDQCILKHVFAESVRKGGGEVPSKSKNFVLPKINPQTMQHSESDIVYLLENFTQTVVILGANIHQRPPQALYLSKAVE